MIPAFVRKFLRESFVEIQSATFHPFFVLLFFSGMLALRVFMESHIAVSQFRFDALSMRYEFIHFFLLLSIMTTSIVYAVHTISKIQLKSVFNTIFATLPFLVLLPPLIDRYVYSNFRIESYYEFYSVQDFLLQFFLFMSKEPYDGTTPGQRITIVLALIGIYFYVSKRTKVKPKLRATLSVLATYFVFYIAATLPSLIVFCQHLFSGDLWAVNDIMIAQFFLSPSQSPPYLFENTLTYALHTKMTFFLLAINAVFIPLVCLGFARDLTMKLIRNIRLPQTLYHIGLVGFGLLIGYMLGGFSYTANLPNAIYASLFFLIVIYAWYVSVIINDYFDVAIDHISNPSRPLTRGDVTPEGYLIVASFLALFCLGSAFYISLYYGFLIASYFILTVLYSAPPLRLKRVPIIATAISASASILIVLMGYSILSPTHTAAGFPPIVGWILFVTLTLCLPIKDLKDEDGDRADNVWTIPSILGQKRARLVIGVSIFVSYLLSLLFFAQTSLFPAALICGTASFWMLISRKGNETFSFSARSLPLLILLLVGFYGVYIIASMLS